MKIRNHLVITLILLLLANTALAQIQDEEYQGLHHWEIPSKDPDRIILTFHGDPATKRAVTWRQLCC